MSMTKINTEELQRLLKSGDGYLSGAGMAAKLGVSRAAVWKAIGRLRTCGYVIDASPSKGYRLINSPDLCVNELREILSRSQNASRHDISYFASATSTNVLAMDMAEKGCPEGAVIIADTQTAGKGRLGRSWLSPAARNLYMSLVIRPAITPRDAAALTFLAAVACSSALEKHCGLPVAIKWPNDLLCGGRKIVGILAEIRADIDSICHAVIGIGVNVNLAEDDMPDDLKKIATSVFIETGRRFSRTGLAAAIIMEFDKWYALLLSKGQKVVIEKWRERCSTIGRQIRIAVGDLIFEGTAEGIDDEGLLIMLMADGSRRKFSAGDVTIGGAEQ
jgi:BirA family transcriptional regulator, biotin operon repressor / biotin---[acetyl-CoA-carboxylase] ligase